MLMLTTALASAALLAGVKARRAEARQDRGGVRQDGARRAAVDVSSDGVPRPLRPAHTFSIVARDPATGELGVAVQSHWFSVGSNVTWAEAGVGAVATQSFIDPSSAGEGRGARRAAGGDD